MYIIKQKPEDFIVEEIPIKFLKKGKYKIYELKKINQTTQQAIKDLKVKNIKYAGNKDKVAVTTQHISSTKPLPLPLKGYLDKPLSLGDLKANKFTIKVRNTKEKQKIKFLENYFDDQRFSKNNKEVGKLIVKKQYKEACRILNIPQDNPIQSLRKEPLRFYIHAYQSYLFNEALKEYTNKDIKVKYSQGYLYFSKTKIKNIKIPLFNFETKHKLYNKIIKKEKITKEDFIFRSLPELISDQVYRDAIITPKFISSSYKNKTQTIKFILPKGSYATMLIKKMFN